MFFQVYLSLCDAYFKSVQLLIKFIVYSTIMMIFFFFAWKLLEAPLVMGFVEKSKYN